LGRLREGLSVRRKFLSAHDSSLEHREPQNRALDSTGHVVLTASFCGRGESVEGERVWQDAR
jgi:hypothetical protein